MLGPDIVLLLTVLVGCGEDTSTQDTGTSDSGASHTGSTDSGTPSPGPCADGSYGPLADPDAAVHVAVGGDDAAAGTAVEPLATFDAALDASQADGGRRAIFLGPGTHAVRALLRPTNGDDGLALVGCSADETVLQAADTTAPVLQLVGVSDLTVEGVTLAGGTHTIEAVDGTTLGVVDAILRDGLEAGLAIDGAHTLVSLERVHVRDVQPLSGAVAEGPGYGISVTRGQLVMTGGSVTGCTLAGVIADDGAVVALDAVEVSGTLPLSDGLGGRGVQLQDQVTATLDGLVLDDNADAAVFALKSLNVSLQGLSISDTAAGTVAGDGTSTGDGVVVTRGDETAGPAFFSATIDSVSIDGSARAALLLSGVTATIDDNAIGSAGYELEGSAVLCQDSAVVSGSDSCVDVEATGTDPLVVYDENLSLPGLE